VLQVFSCDKNQSCTEEKEKGRLVQWLLQALRFMYKCFTQSSCPEGLFSCGLQITVKRGTSVRDVYITLEEITE
jgi:hypothetical protein